MKNIRLILCIVAFFACDNKDEQSQKEYFRYILLFYCRKGKNAVQARKKLCEVYEESVSIVNPVSKLVFKISFRQFRHKVAPRSGRPVKTDENKLKTLIETNR